VRLTDDVDDAKKEQCGLPMMLMMPKTSPLELKKVK